MYRYQQKATKAVIFTNGTAKQGIDITEGARTKQCVNGIISYITESIPGEKLFDCESFLAAIPAISWESDLFPALAVFRAGRIISSIITFFFVKDCIKTIVDGKEYIDDFISTKINLRIIFLKDNEIVTIQKEIHYDGIPETEWIQQKTKEEIEYIDQCYTLYPLCVAENPLEADMILPAGSGGIFIHEAIGHCLEADQYFKKSALLNGRLGKQITHNKSLIISDSCTQGNLIHYQVSDDGTQPSSVNLVADGNLESILTDSFYSSVYGIQDTGNGRASNINSFPIPRMRNTYLHNGKENAKDIIQSIKNGLIPIDIQGGNVITENGNFVFNVTSAFIVQNGMITGIAKPFLFSGNIIDALDSIRIIGNDLKFCKAVCGKCGQMIDVSYGTPTIVISRR